MTSIKYKMNKNIHNKPQRKRLRLKNFDYGNPNYVYFLTICARHLSMPFYNPDLADKIMESLLFIREKKEIDLYCYCLMPDHLHIVISPFADSGTVSKVMQEFKGFTTRVSWEYGIIGKLWQKSFYDHIARKDEDLIAICDYILSNPVRKGLFKDPRDWKYSGLLDPLPVY